jgi:cyclophilin family peptidyl-prolyl cis-trans isomerase
VLRRALPLLFLIVSCSRGSNVGPDASTSSSDASSTGTSDVTTLLKAEDARRAKGVEPALRTSHDVATRRRSARALARIADNESVEGLVAHLADEDLETVAWAAYGLGHACKGKEDAHVRILSARAASLPKDNPQKHLPGTRGAAELDPYVSIARAIGRCAAPFSEQVLGAMLTTNLTSKNASWIDPIILGLGDLAQKQKRLGADTTTTLLEAAGDKSTPHDLAFYPLSRYDAGEAFSKRLIEVARLALGRPSESRILAIRALGRAGKDKDTQREVSPELQRIVVDSAKGYGIGERTEAGRALANLGEAGQAAIGSAIAELTPDAKDPIAIAELAGGRFHVLYTLLSGLGPEAPKKSEPALNVLATLQPPQQPKAGFARRLADLRCSAAAALARGAYDQDILKKCDAEGSEAYQRAQLTSLLRVKTLGKERLNVLRSLSKSEHLRVREQVVEAVGSHDVGNELGASILADALGSKHAGLVATAAETIHTHPERVLVLAESEKRAALDPKSPPPTANPKQELSPAVAKALATALSTPWPEDRFETRIALFEAAAIVGHPKAKEAATVACKDPNQTLRERAQKTLRELGAPITGCVFAEKDVKIATELSTGPLLTKPSKIVLNTDALELTLILEPDLTPVTAARLTGLVKSSFFKGNVVHRVVPGFVVQLGDPEGDGYGGSGTSLRCERMALAGRDTGSSQFFVTLSRTPHLDGEYARVGHAEGDWAAVSQGDVITDARVVE